MQSTPTYNSTASPKRSLPLLVFTPDGWASDALKDIPALLIDHAHLEQKAAANALALIRRWPDDNPGEPWVKALSEVSRDESQHLALVVDYLTARNVSLPKSHHNEYARALRELVRLGTAEKELLDRLIVSSLIEARSCERFYLLAQTTTERELQKLYSGLWSSEHGHYEAFLELAHSVATEAELSNRWQWFLEKEAEIIQSQPPGPRIHSWPSS